ncbi:MAG: SCPU domain-containing protein [Candidatus Tokpelaia sp.]|nr:MAG: SCPU domain-containing protein [Candidatus Tokpelaia sp.]
MFFFVRNINYCFIMLLFVGGEEASAHHCRIVPNTVNFGKIDPLRIDGLTQAFTMTLDCYSITDPTHYCISLQSVPPIGATGNPERTLDFTGANPQDRFIPFQFICGGNLSCAGSIFGGAVNEPEGYGEPIIGTLPGDSRAPTRQIAQPFDAVLGRPGGQDLRTGLYSNRFTASVYWNYSSRYNNGMDDETKKLMCKKGGSGVPGTLVTQSTFLVTANVEKSCSLVVTGINFGKSASLDNVPEAKGAIQVKCSDPTDYQIGLSLGNNSKGENQRSMKCANTDKCGTSLVDYNLYHRENGVDTLWNNKWNTDGIVTSTSNNQTVETPVYARLVPNQGNVPAGLYSDIVIVEIRY